MAEKETKSCSEGCEEMTDNEVIKALEVCAYSDDCLKECPFFNYKADCTKRLTASALEIIKRHQSNVSPVKHGHWVYKERTKLSSTGVARIAEEGKAYVVKNRITVRVPYCSECGDHGDNVVDATPYCPNCGAKMDGGDNE